MRIFGLALLGAAAMSISSAQAGHSYYYRPYIGFGYGFAPYPYYSPWYGPTFGFGIQVGNPYPKQRAPAEQQSAQRALKLYVYPAAGQSAAQTADDRFECHTWAADQSGHDPTLGAGSREEAESYTRALTACMEGRNYVVK